MESWVIPEVFDLTEIVSQLMVKFNLQTPFEVMKGEGYVQDEKKKC